MTLGVFLSSLVISCYGFIYLPSGYISFDQTHRTFQLENKDLSYIPVVCLFLWSFFSFCGFSGENFLFFFCIKIFFNREKNKKCIYPFEFSIKIGMPWMFLSELFPFKWVLVEFYFLFMFFFMGFCRIQKQTCWFVNLKEFRLFFFLTKTENFCFCFCFNQMPMLVLSGVLFAFH